MNHTRAPGRAGNAATPADAERFRLYGELEIASLLRGAIRRRTLVTVTYGSDDDFFVSAFLAVRPERGDIVIDGGPDGEVNARATVSSRIVVGAMLDNVHVQFQATQARATTFDGYSALSLPFPESVLRMQRRESFRIGIPRGERLLCEVREHPSDAKAIQVPVVNISCGGVALENWPDGHELASNRIYRGCRLHLGDDGLLVDLEIVNVVERAGAGGSLIKRCGARFVNMPGPLATQVQRYVLRVERTLLEAQREADERVAGGRGARR